MTLSSISTLIASLLGSEFTSETTLQVQRDFLAIPAMHFIANAIKAAQQDSHSVSATHYISHSPASSHRSVCLHSPVTSHSSVNSHSSTTLHSPHSCRQFHMFTQPRRFAHCPCSIHLLQLAVIPCNDCTPTPS